MFTQNEYIAPLENSNDQAYSCPRDWRHKGSWGPPETPLTTQHYRGIQWGPQLGPHYASRTAEVIILVWNLRNFLFKHFQVK